MISIIICDDNSSYQSQISGYIKNYFDDLNTEYTCKVFNTGEDMLNEYSYDVDIIIMEILLDGLNGIDICRKIREKDKRVEIIFITVEPDYVYDAFDVRAFRFIIKPLKELNFKNAFKLCVDEVLEKVSKVQINHKGNKYIINTLDILYVEVRLRSVIIHTTYENYSFTMTLTKIERLLNYPNFYRCHRSFIINLKYITKVYNNMVCIKDLNIPVSRFKLKIVKNLFNEYFFRNGGNYPKDNTSLINYKKELAK